MIINEANEFLKSYSGVVDTFGILATIILTIYIFRFENKLDIKTRLAHKYKLIDKLNLFEEKIRSGKRNKVAIIDVDHYDEYPEIDRSYSKSSYKSYFHNGVYIWTGFTFYTDDEKMPNMVNNRIGFIPFDNIEFIDLEDDGSESCPKFYVKFKKTKSYKIGNKNYKTPFTKWYYTMKNWDDLTKEFDPKLRIYLFILDKISFILSYKIIVNFENFLKTTVEVIQALKRAKDYNNKTPKTKS